MKQSWFFAAGLLCQLVHFCAFEVVEANFNLYLSAGEMKRTLGLSKELYYVREGVANEYALNFLVTIPAQINALHFTWQALGQKPMPYSSSIESSDSIAMGKPTLSIPSNGFVPIEPETFQLLLPCTGILSDEIKVKLILNVTQFTNRSAKNILVTLKRKKICLEDPSLEFGMRLVPSTASTSLNELEFEPKPKHNQITNSTDIQVQKYNNSNSIGPDDYPQNLDAILVVVGCSVGLAIFVTVSVYSLLAIFRRQKVSAHGTESSGFLHVDTSANGSSTNPGSIYGNGGRFFIQPESPHHYSSVSPCLESDTYGYSTFLSPNNQDTFYSEIPSYTKHYKFFKANSTCVGASTLTIDSNKISCKLAEEITIQRHRVRLENVIMEGTFAKVYNGTLLEKDGSEKAVVVKTVSDHSSPAKMALLLKEALTLIDIVGDHVYSVIGVAYEERTTPPFLIYPDEAFRNLKRFLESCSSGEGRLTTTPETIHMAIQVGRGIDFLHRQNIAISDIATRNCVVDAQLVVKVSDNGLSKDLFPEDYSRIGCGEILPVKWMAPEAIIQYKTSVPADVWSFGVLLWELTTLAEQPYAQIDPGDILPLLNMNYRLSQPTNCQNELYSAMTKCWTWDPENRPKLTNLLQDLEDLQSRLVLYI